MDHYGDGIQSRHSSPAISDPDEAWQNCEHNESGRRKQRVRKLGLRRSPMGGNDGVPPCHSVAKISVRGTDRLHHADEHDNTIIHR